MFRDLKLKTVTILLVLILGSIGCILAYGMWSLHTQNLRIDDLWHQYQVDRSDKARLHSHLRKAIGYGGMIHNFKNYILRQDPQILKQLHENFGAARASLAQYIEISNSSVENAAIQDILAIITKYERAAQVAESLVNTKASVAEIDAKVNIDDLPGKRALALLQNEIEIEESQQLLKADMHRKRMTSKGRLISDLRASIGYGGMIHEFKDYVLRQNVLTITRIQANLESALKIINDYHSHKLNSSEQTALNDITQTLKLYRAKIVLVKQMIDEGKTTRQIDESVYIDDNYALRGLSILEKEISLQATESANEVNSSLHGSDVTIKRIGGTILILVISMIFLSLWLMLNQVIAPAKRLTELMTDLANDRLDIEVDGLDRTNEMGAMARAVNVFKENALQRKVIEDKLEESNKSLNVEINHVEQLRKDAQKQARKAMSLADNLADAHDTAERARSQAESKHHEIQMILNTVQDAIICADRDGNITSFNPAAESIFGYSAREAIGSNLSILMPKEMAVNHNKFFMSYLEGSRTRSPYMTVEQIAQRKDGQQFPIEISLNSMYLNEQIHFTAVIRDITTRKESEEEIKRLAMNDSLTGLANRNQFEQRLNEAIVMAERQQYKFVLLMMDLDKFKPVNDQYGHLVGDAALAEVAKKLKHVFRSIDTIARYGGDEFAGIVTTLHSSDDALHSIKRVLNALTEKIVINGHVLDIGISIGASIYPDDTTDAKTLIEYADIALYHAKEKKGNQYCFYTSNTSKPLNVIINKKLNH